MSATYRVDYYGLTPAPALYATIDGLSWPRAQAVAGELADETHHAVIVETRAGSTAPEPAALAAKGE
jgi:hypothetical protein